MKLCLDVGNSHIYGGVYDSDRALLHSEGGQKRVHPQTNTVCFFAPFYGKMELTRIKW